MPAHRTQAPSAWQLRGPSSTLIDGLTPHYAGWYAGDDPWSSVYGGPLRLASDARRFDVSPRGTPGLPPPRPCGLRLSFHVSTSGQDADLAADVLRRHVTSRHPATL
jgi:hypothetical protein